MHPTGFVGWFGLILAFPVPFGFNRKFSCYQGFVGRFFSDNENVFAIRKKNPPISRWVSRRRKSQQLWNC
jgi:hypothetical protein